MTRRTLGLAAALLAAAATAATAQSLTIGDPAPPIAAGKWYKGEPVKAFEPGKTYVVEFWATWCGPCKTSIPHLTALQKKHEDVPFLGVSVFEQDQSAIEPFVKDMGDKMGYRVAGDDVSGGDKGKMAEAWMEASGEPGIPTAFVVKDGKVAWIGHPMSLDEPLAKIVAGTYDIQKAAEDRDVAKAKEKAEQSKLARLGKAINSALEDGEPKKAVAALDAAFGDDPELEGQFSFLKFNLLLRADDDAAASAYGYKLIDGLFKDSADSLNNLAWTIVDPESDRPAAKRDVKLALKAAQRANDIEEGKNPAILDTLAKAQFDNGDVAKALEHQEKAVKLSGDEVDPGMKDRLAIYRKAAEKK